ncbi:hypothetical protein [Parabacteroides goldsteinii]|uniref:hypothetical protein n=1 Tax=Parabacteroides goldsteinii TaxID=328812 RepID=UPI003AB7F14D
MTAKRIHRQIKPNTASNASGLDEIIQKQVQREKQSIFSFQQRFAKNYALNL